MPISTVITVINSKSIKAIRPELLVLLVGLMDGLAINNSLFSLSFQYSWHSIPAGSVENPKIGILDDTYLIMNIIKKDFSMLINGKNP